MVGVMVLMIVSISKSAITILIAQHLVKGSKRYPASVKTRSAVSVMAVSLIALASLIRRYMKLRVLKKNMNLIFMN